VPHTAPKRIIDPVVRVVARTGITPNGVSVLGFAWNCVAALLATRGLLFAAGVMMLAGSALDLVDGALARATGRATRFGAVFDAVLDRYSEALMLLGLVVHEADHGAHLEVGLLFAALTGSVLVSHVRALAETLGHSLREGLFTRVERVLLTGAALILSPWAGWALPAALVVLATLTNLTALQRLYHVHVKERERQHTEGRGTP
jgi:CDP-diacylglycerol---glycerol-3-phosphate 3-phosphatidyltransferase